MNFIIINFRIENNGMSQGAEVIQYFFVMKWKNTERKIFLEKWLFALTYRVRCSPCHMSVMVHEIRNEISYN